MENIESIDFSITTNRSNKKTCSNCRSADHTILKCPLKPCRHCGEMGHIYATCPTKKEEDRKRKRTANQTEEQNQMQRERHLAANQTEGQNQMHRQRNRLENMPEERAETQRERHRLENMPEEHRDVVLVALPVSTPNLPVSVWYLFGKIETYQL